MKENSLEQIGAFPDLKHDEAVIMSPGALLRHRRLALNLNEWDIAREMRLQTQYILDLEADNFDAFSSLAFVRGYLRGYAKLVGVAEVDVMQLFNQLALQDKVATGIPKYITHDNSRSDRYWRWMGLGVVAFIVISLVLWWQNYNFNIKTLNTSVNTTLKQVSTLQKTLQTGNAPAQTQTAAANATPDQVTGALGASADLLNNASTTNATTPVSAQNNATVPAVTSASNGANTNVPASTIAAPTTNVGTSPAAITANNNNVNPNTLATQPKKKRKQSNSSLSSAYAPIVDGQAPRLGDN